MIELCGLTPNPQELHDTRLKYRKLQIRLSSSFVLILSSVKNCLVKTLILSLVKVEYDGIAIIIDRQRKIIISGSIHYSRSTEQMRPDLIQEAKNGGLDAVETNIFWDRHEPKHGEV
ncbi:hypothetical protein DITRI_Ditri10aG0095100 [Diplodiscus trichospermus]